MLAVRVPVWDALPAGVEPHLPGQVAVGRPANALDVELVGVLAHRQQQPPRRMTTTALLPPRRRPSSCRGIAVGHGGREQEKQEHGDRAGAAPARG